MTSDVLLALTVAAVGCEVHLGSKQVRSRPFWLSFWRITVLTASTMQMRLVSSGSSSPASPWCTRTRTGAAVSGRRSEWRFCWQRTWAAPTSSSISSSTRASTPGRLADEDVMPLIYRWTGESNPSSWMTTDIFTRWLMRLDRKFHRMDKKVALVLDNASSHPPSLLSSLRSIKLIFLPPNTTSVIQPISEVDQWSKWSKIIADLKRKFRTQYYRSSLRCNAPWNILTACNAIDQAWREVLPSTISNSYQLGTVVSSIPLFLPWMIPRICNLQSKVQKAYYKTLKQKTITEFFNWTLCYVVYMLLCIQNINKITKMALIIIMPLISL